MESKKKTRKRKIVVAGIAVAAAGVLGYFGWQYWKKKKAGRSGEDDASQAALPDSPVVDLPSVTPLAVNSGIRPRKITSSPKRKKAKEGFPLRKGSKGDLVRQLQQALLAKHGKAILPKFGADADFGSETMAALKKLELPVTITESIFNVIVQGTRNTGDDTNIGKALYSATSLGDFKKVLALLKQMKGAEDYSTANDDFKKYRIRGVRQTIVNGLLGTFTGSQQNEQIKYEFLRIGLQFDGSKWSLPVLDGIPIITTIPTTVWINANKGVNVPARMVLGNEVSRKLDYSLFENKGKYFLVNTRCVKHLK